jgi:hypothetical protein
VPEVWALYPSKHGQLQSQYYRDHNVRLVELSPSFNNDHLIHDLNQMLDNMVQRYQSVLV